MGTWLGVVLWVMPVGAGEPPQPGEPMPAEVRAAVDAAADGLREAMRQRDAEGVRRSAERLREALGEWAGVPERKLEFRAGADVERRLGRAHVEAMWSAAWTRAEADCNGAGQWGLPRVEHPEVKHTLLRQTAYAVMGGLSALRHGIGEREAVRRRVDEGLAYLLGIQRRDGLFPFPDLRPWHRHFAPPLQALHDLHPEAFVDGWVVEDYGDGGLQFDNGVCAVAMIGAYEHLGDRRCLESARRACAWAAARPIVVNWNYNAFTIWAQARYARATGDICFIEAAVERLQLGVLPGQLAGGRWMDPHNARTVYHAIILRAMAELYAVLREDHPAARPLRDAIGRAEGVLIDEILAHGPTDADHSLSALCAVERAMGPDLRRTKATRAISNAIYAQLADPRREVLDDLTLFAVGEAVEQSARIGAASSVSQE